MTPMSVKSSEYAHGQVKCTALWETVLWLNNVILLVCNSNMDIEQIQQYDILNSI